MTMFHNFTGMFRKQDIILFSDFISSVVPFGTATSAAGASAAAITNAASSELGKLTIGVASTTGTAAFHFAGVYMAQTEASAGAGVTRDYRLGNGEIDFSARLKKGVGTNANVMLNFGISDADYSATNRPAQHFAGFTTRFDTSPWTISLRNGTAAIDIPTTIAADFYADLRVVVSANAKAVSFYANGTFIRTIQFDMSKTAAVLPCIEVKDKTSGGSGTVCPCEIDHMTIRQQVLR